MGNTDSNLENFSSVESWVRCRLTNQRLSPALRTSLEELARAIEQIRTRDYEYFLSVVLRTQGRRPEQLCDALLCLYAQTDQDFETVLVLHDVEESERESIQSIVHSFPSSFSARVRILPASGVGRMVPLNAAIEVIRGQYVAFYDDDDLLMANWVENFKQVTASSPGRVVRSNVAVQRNRLEKWPDGSGGHRSISLASAEYAESFNLIDHLERNHSPFMGIAFPASFFTDWGERFDVALAVCEDWDVILRAVGLLGVESSPSITAIYRRWEDANTSYTDHDLQVWRASESRVRKKMDSSAFLAPEGTLSAVLEKIADERTTSAKIGARLNEVLGSTSWRISAPLRRVIDRARRLRRF